MRIRYLQHVPFEGPGAIASWAQSRGHALAGTFLSQGDPLPRPQDFDQLVVLGGPMSVHDDQEYPWLKDEKKLIADTLRAEKTVLGVCLGAQLLAHVLGGRVYRAPEMEIGWFPVQMRPEARSSRRTAGLPERFLAFHWHGETFDLPAGAAHLAETAACPNQAFEVASHALGISIPSGSHAGQRARIRASLRPRIRRRRLRSVRRRIAGIDSSIPRA